MINRCVRALHCVAVLFFVTACAQSPAAVAQSGAVAATDPLPSWNEGATKAAIRGFVQAVTTAGSPDFVPPPQRVATFDNDGTLWAEQPMYFQFLFVVDRIRALAGEHPDWKSKEPYRSVLAGDTKALAASGEKGAVDLLAVTHAGMTVDQFADDVRSWMQVDRPSRCTAVSRSDAGQTGHAPNVQAESQG